MNSRKKPPARVGPVRAAIYTRVSTEDQSADDKTSLDDQEKACREYIDYKGYELAGVWREDGKEGSSSGTSFDRPKWRDLEAACRRGEIDLIVFAKHDRFARSAWRAGQKEEELRDLGTGIVLLNMNVDTSTPNGRFMFNMLMAGAQWERDTSIERLSRGAHGAVRNGKWPSSSRAAPLGYMKVGTGRDSHLEIHPGEAATIRLAVQLLLDDRMELPAICELLNARGMFPRGRSVKGGGNEQSWPG